MKAFTSILIILTTFTSCVSKETKIHTNARGIADDSKDVVTKQLRATYSKYDKLTAKFVLKGKVDKAEILYDGTLEVSENLFLVVLRDPVFRSPFFSLKIVGDQVTQTDHLRNKSEKVPFENYRWVALFGQIFPFRFFYPVLKGYLPNEVFEKTTKYEALNDNKGKYTFQNEVLEAIVNIENNVMSSLFYKEKTSHEIVVISFIGQSNTLRYFPAKIYITRPRSNDFVSLEFSHVKITAAK